MLCALTPVLSALTCTSTHVVFPSYCHSVVHAIAADQSSFNMAREAHQCISPVLLLGCRYRLPEDQVSAAVETALELVNMKEFMHRATHTLSGGQRQRVAIAGGSYPGTQPAEVVYHVGVLFMHGTSIQ